MTEDILKPKSVKDINVLIKNMNIYEFVTVFKDVDISPFNVSIKKRLYHLILSNQNKNMMRYAWIIFMLFQTSNILMICFKDRFFIISTIIFASMMLICIVLCSLIINMRSKLFKWKMDNDMY